MHNKKSARSYSFTEKDAASEAEKQKHLNKLSARAMQYIAILKRCRNPIPVLDRRCHELGTDPLEPPPKYGLSGALQTDMKNI